MPSAKSDLTRITVQGFKSFPTMMLEIGRLNVISGASSSGKSNVVLFFAMLNEIMGSRLQRFLLSQGGNEAILFNGAESTPQLKFSLEYRVSEAFDTYSAELFAAADNSLIFALEFLKVQKQEWAEPQLVNLGAGHREAQVMAEARQKRAVARVFRHLLNNTRVLLWNRDKTASTLSESTRFWNDGTVRLNGANLPSALYYLRVQDPPRYRKIVDAIRFIFPSFDDFVLEPFGPSDRFLTLQWQRRGSSGLLGVHHLSDRLVHVIALICVLLQPPHKLPYLLVIDQPDLGATQAEHLVLHRIISDVAKYRQVIVTANPEFAARFDNEYVTHVLHDGQCSSLTTDLQT